jgi:hypothetical protein
MTPTWTCEWCGNVSLRSEDYLLHKKDCLVRRSAKLEDKITRIREILMEDD